MVLKQYSPEEQEFVFQWVDRWFRLGKLIFDLMCFDIIPLNSKGEKQTRVEEPLPISPSG